MTQQVVYGFILKMKQLILINLNTADTDAFKFFKYKDRLIRNIVAQPTSNEANKILVLQNCNKCCTNQIS